MAIQVCGTFAKAHCVNNTSKVLGTYPELCLWAKSIQSLYITSKVNASR